MDWQLNRYRCVFAALGGQRLFDTDRFASETNALAERFDSRWACPGTAGVDALLQDDGHTLCRGAIRRALYLLLYIGRF